MFRDIRKKKNQISTEAAELLWEARRGILAVNGREGYPYAIPINYYYDREAQKIYFHGARAGHKVEAIRACDKVCFTVYGGETIREEAWAPTSERRGVRPVSPAGQSPETMALLKRFAMYYPRSSWQTRRSGRMALPPSSSRSRSTTSAEKSAGEVSISSPVCSCRDRKKKNSTPQAQWVCGCCYCRCS